MSDTFLISIDNVLKIKIHQSLSKSWIGFLGKSSFIYFKLPINFNTVMTNKSIFFLFPIIFYKKKSLLMNLVKQILLDVQYGFSVKVKLVGVGYKIEKQKKELILKLGYSHDIIIPLVTGLNCKKWTDRSSIYIFSFSDRRFLKNFIFKLKKYRPAEPYKGKGMRYVEEIVKRKEGKKSNL